ncbi:MAG TPA: ABC transporter permease subunit [Candidatus Acidoferrales bacterium]|nr:ABC transporter permease subunit [Candidatus Acidoferrales bacterium]
MSFLALLRKELHAYFVSPLFYVVAAVFLGLCGFFFYTRLVFFVEYGLGENILGNFWLAFLAGAPYSISTVLLLVMPLLTMRLFAEEKRLGTIELLLTYPVRDGELFCAKFAACALVCVLLLLGTLLYPLYLSSLQPVPWGAVLAGYFGLLLLGFSFIACGILISSLTDNQVVAAVCTIGFLLACWVLTWNEAATSPELLRVLIHLSMFDHFEPFARGTIDAEHVAYFIFFVIFCSFLTLRVLEARTWRGRR